MRTKERFRISQVSDQTGFSGPTLRYYEEIGLLPPPARTEAGYRVYSRRDVDRLTFIARAKRLGCTLDEIRELAQAWDRDNCGPVQHQLRSLVGAKVAESQAQLVELMAFTSDLQGAAAQLSGRPTEGACDEACACLAPVPAANGAPSPVMIGVGPDPSPPIVCTLGASDMEGRLDEWQAVVTTAINRTVIEGGVRLEFAANAPLAEIARLAAAEYACCMFLSFAITVDQRGVGLEVTSRPEAAAVVAVAFWGGRMSAAAGRTTGER